ALNVLLNAPLDVAVAARAGAQAATPPVVSGWPQWGGPTRDFKTTSKGLAATWPASGPRELWSRPLGDGYSSLLVDDVTIYTMYHPAGFVSSAVAKLTFSHP